MSVMFELYYKRPKDKEREDTLTAQIAALNGRLDFREESKVDDVANHVCLTYEFDEWQQADDAAEVLRRAGEHVEGPYEYGN